LANALFLTILPEPVALNLFAAPRFVLSFGILILLASLQANKYPIALLSGGSRGI
jgi:hypothetical protein